MKYNFDEKVDRRGTHAIKWEAGELLKAFGLTERFDEETIPLFIADMDFPCPQPVLDALHARVDRKIFGYSLPSTSSDYVEAIRGWFKRRHNWEIAVDSIIYCPGTMEAIDVLIRTCTAENEGIIVQRPVFAPFTRAIEANKRRVVNNALINQAGYYTIDFDDFEQKAQEPQNKLFILCSPHNPIGRVWQRDELVRMIEICLANDVKIVADEIHGDLIRKGQRHYPICSLADDNRLIACTSTNKTFNMAGLHCSNIIINNQEMREQFSRALGMKSPTPFAITALMAAYNQGEEWLAQVNEYIDGNLAFMNKFLRENMPQVRFTIPEGTYIGWLDFREYGLTAVEIHDRIYNKANVVLEDGTHYGSEGVGFQRICVPTPRPILQEALERIAAQFQ